MLEYRVGYRNGYSAIDLYEDNKMLCNIEAGLRKKQAIGVCYYLNDALYRATKNLGMVVRIGEDYCTVKFKDEEYELPLVVADMLGGIRD